MSYHTLRGTTSQSNERAIQVVQYFVLSREMILVSMVVQFTGVQRNETLRQND